eukprot:scaffold256463_cov28-Tisochrysis_lutea.AAC.3
MRGFNGGKSWPGARGVGATSGHAYSPRLHAMSLELGEMQALHTGLSLSHEQPGTHSSKSEV